MNKFDRKNLMFQVVENMASMARIMDSNDNIIYMNKRMRAAFGDMTGTKCYTLLCGAEKCTDCISLRCRESNRSESKDVSIGDKQYRIIASPAIVTGEEKYSIEIIYDITEQKMLEQKFYQHYEKLKGDIAFAKQIQRKALPEDGTYYDMIKINSVYIPSEDLGGDLFDIVRIDDDNCLFYIADVSGHGVRSSMLTIFLRQVIRGMRNSAANLTALLDELIKSYHDLKLNNELYISVLCGLYNKNTKGLSFVNAGHNCLPIVLEKHEGKYTKATELNIEGMPICALLTESNHEIKTFQMEKGDRIIFYTDGVTEGYNGYKNKEFGIDGLKEVILAHGNSGGKVLVKQIIREARNFVNLSPVDDMAVILAEVL